MVDLVDGLVARTQNAWPSPDFDLMAVNSLLVAAVPVRLLLQDLHGPDQGLLDVLRALHPQGGGAGQATDLPDPDRYDMRYAFCDVLVIGSGPAGLAAALTAGRSGARVVLAEQDSEFGGSLLSGSDARA